MKKRKKDIFYQYLCTYFVVLFIPLVICSVYCVRMLYMIGKDDVQSYEAELKHSAVLVENMLTEISDTGNVLVSNPQVNSFQYRKDVYKYPNAYKVNELQQALPELYQMNQSIFAYFLFFNQSDMVVNPYVAYSYEDFYDLYLRREKYEDYESWYHEIKDSSPDYGLGPVETYTIKEEERVNLLVYTQPLLSTNDNSALRIYFKDTALEQLLPLMADSGIQYIINEQGELLYYKSNQKEVDYQKLREQVDNLNWEKSGMKDRGIKLGENAYFAVKYHSENSGLIFYALQPETIVNGRRMFNAVLLMLLILLSVTLGIAASYWMAKKTTTPISDILREVSHMMGGTKENSPPFAILQTTFKELYRTNSTLKEAMERQKPFMQNAFLNRLIYGDMISETEAKQMAESLNLKAKDMVFAILIFRFEMGEDFIWNQNEELVSFYTLSLMEALEKVLPLNLYANLGENQTILLFETSKENRENLREEANKKVLQIRMELPPEVSERIVVYGGSETDCLTSLHESYNDAVFLTWNGKGRVDSEIIWYNRTGVGVPVYPPADFGGKLTYCVVTGDGKGLHDELEKVLKQYIFENNLPVYLQHMLLNELQIVLFRTLHRIRMAEDEYRIYYRVLEESRTASLLEQFSATLNAFQTLCEYVSQQRQDQGIDTMIASVVSYIDMNYMDSNLSLAGVADNFKVGESALSSLFKQSIGINFSAYVENVRLEKAKVLLKTTELSIGEIAQKVGYSSVNSFCRAFKRVTGKNASACREK